VWHEAFTCITSPIYTCLLQCAPNQRFEVHLFKCVTWHIYMYNVTICTCLIQVGIQLLTRTHELATVESNFSVLTYTNIWGLAASRKANHEFVRRSVVHVYLNALKRRIRIASSCVEAFENALKRTKCVKEKQNASLYVEASYTKYVKVSYTYTNMRWSAVYESQVRALKHTKMH